MYIKKNDTVVLTTGKYKGVSGKVLAVNPDTNKVVVEGVAIVSKSKKARSAQEQGGIIKKEAMVDASNVALVCSNADCVKNGKATRIKMVTEVVNGKEVKVRVCAKCGKPIEAKKAAPAKKVATKKAPAKKKVEAEATEEPKAE